MAILLTGATGSFGLELLRSWAARREMPDIYCLVRAPDTARGLARWEAFCEVHSLGRRFIPVVGDIEQTELGLSLASRRDLQARITTIVHAAAHIRFDAPYALAHAVNVAGTARLLDFARGCAKLNRVCQISTLYVAGQRMGLVPVGGGPDGAPFNNSYEQTKLEAEAVALGSGLPVEIVRLSLMPGRQSDGHVHRYLDLHMLFEAFGRGLCSAVPGNGETCLDMLPVDYSAACLAAHLDEPAFTPGAIHALAAGKQAPSLTVMYESIAMARSQRGLPVPPPPAFLPDADYAALLSSEEPEQFGVSFGTQTILRTVGGYLAKAKTFAPSEKLLAFTPTPLAEWLPRVIGFALDDNWGRRRNSPARMPAVGKMHAP
ncbi:MAG: SDR family oxidoreductase [Alphaproteobacteria bacterium]|nr:SDR family oxidoreductase [Alphaproteobacteria bacterium]